MRENISFIGSGNVAWHLASALDHVGFVVKEIYSRNPEHAAQLTDRLYSAEVKTTLDFSTSDSTIFIIAVNDDSIRDVAKEIILPEAAILVHTSGAVALDELRFAATPNIGVFYPLQTLSKRKEIDFKPVPIFIESHTPQTEKVLLKLGNSISHQVKKISSEERKALHVAAVFASNFTTHMITLSESIMQKNQLNIEWLKPLITETINKVLQVGGSSAQTGPAKRGDLETLEVHKALLHNDPRLSEVYQFISQHILNYYRKE